jgi:hypothetical protein
MRKFLLVGLVAAIGAALLAVPANASFDHHFRVISRSTSIHQNGDTTRFRDKLVATFNHHNQVGHDRGKCVALGGGHRKCQAIEHLNGEVGGSGDIKVNGDLGPGDSRLNVVGGTGDFNGVGGKMTVKAKTQKASVLKFDLTR